jgi:hypothetical protein
VQELKYVAEQFARRGGGTLQPIDAQLRSMGEYGGQLRRDGGGLPGRYPE